MGLKAGKLGGQLVGPVDGEGGAGGTDRLLEGKVVVVDHGDKAPVRALQDKMVYTLCAKFPHGQVKYCVLD